MHVGSIVNALLRAPRKISTTGGSRTVAMMTQNTVMKCAVTWLEGRKRDFAFRGGGLGGGGWCDVSGSRTLLYIQTYAITV